MTTSSANPIAADGAVLGEATEEHTADADELCDAADPMGKGGLWRLGLH